MSGFIRLIDGLILGDPTSKLVLTFTIIGTVVILGIIALIRRARKKE